MEAGRILLGDSVWAPRAERAVSAFDRMRGLLGRGALGAGAALLIERCGAVHTVGMRFALDLVFIDRQGQVVRVVRGVPPGRLMVWGGWRAASVVELEAGSQELAGLAPGTRLAWSPRRESGAGGEKRRIS